MNNNYGWIYLIYRHDYTSVLNSSGNNVYEYSDGSGSYYGADGSHGTKYSDGSGSYYGADGSHGSRYSDGSVSYYGADGSHGTLYSDGSGSFYGADGETVYYSNHDLDAVYGKEHDTAATIGKLIGSSLGMYRIHKENRAKDKRYRETGVKEDKVSLLKALKTILDEWDRI